MQKKSFLSKKFNPFQRIILDILMPVLLIGYWIVAITLYLIIVVFNSSNNKLGFSVVTQNHVIQKTFDHNFSSTNKKIVIEFTATDNNLSIVLLRFNTPKMRTKYEDEEELEFVLIDKAANTTIQKSNIRSGLIEDSPLFPWGFIPIPISLNREYVLTIETYKDNDNHSLSVSYEQPILFTAYKYDRKKIFENTDLLLHFISRKLGSIFNNISNIEAIKIFFYHLLPLFIYLAWRFASKKFHIINTILFIFLSISYPFYQVYSDVSISITVGMVVAIMVLWKIFFLHKYYFALVYSFVWIVLSIGSIILGYKVVITDKLSFWAYIFILIAVFQMLQNRYSQKRMS